MKRILSSPFFLVAALAFLLPFFSVQCAGGGELGDLGIPTGQADLEPDVTGLELITGEAEDVFASTGQTPAIPGIPGLETPIPGFETPIPEIPTTPAQEVDLGTVQYFAIAAAAIAVLGILLSLFGRRSGGALALLLGAGGAVVLFLTFTQFEDAIFDSVGPEAQGFLEVKQELGFWLALGGFAVAALTGLFRVVMPGGGGGVRPGPRPAGAGTASGFGPPPSAPPPAGPPPASPPQPPPGQPSGF